MYSSPFFKYNVAKKIGGLTPLGHSDLPLYPGHYIYFSFLWIRSNNELFMIITFIPEGIYENTCHEQVVLPGYPHQYYLKLLLLFKNKRASIKTIRIHYILGVEGLSH